MWILLLQVFLFSICAICDAREAVYMDAHCGETYYMSDPDIRVKLTHKSSYQPNMDCWLTLTGDYIHEDRLMIAFQDLNIERGNSYNACDNDWLEIHEGSHKNGQTIGKRRFCGWVYPSTVYTSSESSISFRFKSDHGRQDGGFDLILTHYQTGVCDSWEIECDNGRCIDDSLRCNGENSCGDYSDCQAQGGVIAAIVGGVIGAIAATVSTITVICCLVSRRRRNMARPQGHVIMTTAGPPQQNVYGQPAPQYQVNISTVSGTSYPVQNATSYPVQNATSYPPVPQNST